MSAPRLPWLEVLVLGIFNSGKELGSRPTNVRIWQVTLSLIKFNLTSLNIFFSFSDFASSEDGNFEAS